MVALALSLISSPSPYTTTVIVEARLLLSSLEHIPNSISLCRLVLGTDRYTGVAKQYVQ
jgi:hypothetical protein